MTVWQNKLSLHGKDSSAPDADGTIIVVAPECIPGQRLLASARVTGCRVVSVVLISPEQDAGLRGYILTDPDHPGDCDRLIWRYDYATLLSDLADERNVIAVIPGSELGVELADRLAEHFGVRGNPVATSVVRRNKFEMKRAIAAAGLDHAKGMFVRSAKEAVEFVRRELEYPVVAKPPEGASAHNVFFCQNEDELVRRVNQIIGSPDVYEKISCGAVIEEFVSGDEYAVNLFGDDERLVVTSVWRYEWRSTPFCSHCYWNEFLQDPDDPALSELCDYARRLYRAVDMRLGSAHAEIRLSPRGPVAMEIGARLMGAANETFGDVGMRLDMPMENIKVFATGRSDVPDRPMMHERLGYATLPYVTEGVVTAVRGLDIIRVLPTYHSEIIGAKPGDRIFPSRGLDDFACGVWLKAATEAELVRDLRIVHDVFRVETA